MDHEPIDLDHVSVPAFFVYNTAENVTKLLLEHVIRHRNRPCFYFDQNNTHIILAILGFNEATLTSIIMYCHMYLQVLIM